jgi:hypothetical protein
MGSTEDIVWKYIAGASIGLFGLALLVNSCRSVIPRFRLRQRPKAKPPRERDVELGNISEGSLAVAEPEPEPEAGGEPLEDLDVAVVVTLEEKQRFVAGKLGSSLKCPHRNGTALPPGYAAATRRSARQIIASREGAQNGKKPASASRPEPPEYDRAISTQDTDAASAPPPIYDASDPHPRSERRYISFIKISRDVEALSKLRDASESAEERLGFALGVEKLNSLSNYGQGNTAVPRCHRHPESRLGIVVEGNVLKPVEGLVDGLLRPSDELITLLLRLESPWMARQFRGEDA